VISWILYLSSAVIIALMINRFVIVNAFIPTESMSETIEPKDRVLANRLHYKVSDPKRGDIVVFRFPDNEEVLYVKRIIGLPEDTVEVKEGKVFINGEIIDEPYLKDAPTGNWGPYEVPEGKYFMMGDNRNISADSRYWTNKYVDREKIIGKVFLRYFPRIKFFR
ncbi:MAG: signal peptidase I, partial [Clostridiaceae bacterium]|nr:signal peptidase I [Clostridiaceae bacterium]